MKLSPLQEVANENGKESPVQTFKLQQRKSLKSPFGQSAAPEKLVVKQPRSNFTSQMLNATDASTKQSPFVKSFQEDDEGSDLKQTPEQWAKQSQFRFSSQFDSHVPDKGIPQFKTYQSEVKEAPSDRNSNDGSEKTFKMESESD